MNYCNYDELFYLLYYTASYDLLDYRGRTPLHLAVEYDRSFAVQLLMGLPQPASCVVRDNFGQLALATMIENMPKLVSCIHVYSHTQKCINYLPWKWPHILWVAA